MIGRLAGGGVPSASAPGTPQKSGTSSGKWGSRWRPGNTLRAQFCRRKVIWDAILARVASGRSEEEAVAEVEQLRAGQSLSRLVDILKQRRQPRRR